MSIPLVYQDIQDIRPQDIYYPVGTKEIIKTEHIWLEHIDILSELCHISKNLWNESNYVVRQLFTEKDKDGNSKGNYMKYSDLIIHKGGDKYGNNKATTMNRTNSV